MTNILDRMTVAACERCGLSLPTGRRGRRAKYCSTGCRQAAWRERAGASETPAAGPDMAVVVEGALAAAVDVPDMPGAVDALAVWLAETLDGLAPAARAVYGPKLARVLLDVLQARGRSDVAEDNPLEALRASRAARIQAG